MKFGAQFTRFQGGELSRPQPSGQYGFDGRWTQAWNANGGRNGQTGIRFADFILGRVNTINAEIADPIDRRTLNIGLRYEVESPVHEKTGRMNGFCAYCPSPLAGQNGIPDGAIGTMTFPNRNGAGKYLWKWDKNNIAPRFGFAWRATGKDNFVIRGGIGLYSAANPPATPSRSPPPASTICIRRGIRFRSPWRTAFPRARSIRSPNPS